MTTNILKSKITKAIEGINDKSFLEALYTIVNKQIEPFEYELTDEDLRIVESRKKALKSGKAKTITMSEMRKRFTRKFAS
jgi:hypothetical protein